MGKNREISDFCLNLPQISRIHAKIEEDRDGYMITDLNSTNGTECERSFPGNK
ncbi:MAG: FHA domain-containing protein [Roseburia sp.]